VCLSWCKMRCDVSCDGVPSVCNSAHILYLEFVLVRRNNSELLHLFEDSVQVVCCALVS